MPALFLPLLLCVLPLAGSQDEIVPVEFSTLSGFDWQEGQELPATIRALQGKKIGITGFVRSFDGSDEDITGFWLVDQNCDCEGIPKMNEVIVCWMPEGKSISNDGSPIRVVGTFEVGEQKDGDYVTSIFRINVESVD